MQKKHLIIFLTIVAIFSPWVSIVFSEEIRFDRRPLHGKFYDKPGRYELQLRPSQTIVDPGDFITIEVYVTGYGEIQTPKLAVLVSEEVFDARTSKITHSLKIVEDADHVGISFGASTEDFDSFGKLISIKGLKLPGWEYPTHFFDVTHPDDSARVISTEKRMDTPPFLFKCKLNSEVRPGDYILSFILIYFNGLNWEASKENIPFTVRNWLQRNELWVVWIGSIAALLTIIAVLPTGCRNVKNGIRWICRRLS